MKEIGVKNKRELLRKKTKRIEVNKTIGERYKKLSERQKIKREPKRAIKQRNSQSEWLIERHRV